MSQHFIPIDKVTPPSRDHVETIDKIDDFAWYIPRRSKNHRFSSFLSRDKMTSVETQTIYFIDPESKYAGFVQMLYSNVLGGVYKGFQINFKIFSPNKDLEDQFNVWESIKLDGNTKFQDSGLTIKGDNVTFQFRDPIKVSKKIIEGTDNNDNNEKPKKIFEIITNLKIKVKVPSVGLSVDLRCNLGKGFKISPDGCSIYLDKQISKDEIKRIKSNKSDISQLILKNKYLRHQFAPLGQIFGMIKYNNKKYGKQQVLKLKYSPMIYLDAVQGMLPNKVAKRWNFLYFQSPNYAILAIEYLTIERFDNVKVTIWTICEGNEIKYIGSDINNNEMIKFNSVERDSQNGWEYPTGMTFNFMNGDERVPSFTVKNLNLVNRYDILGELPSIVNTLARKIANIKPYLYQFCQPSKYKDEEGISIIESTFIS